MRKWFLVAMVSCLLFIAACKKSNSGAGSWTFAGTTYTAAGAVFSSSDNSLYANNGANNPSSITIYFPAAPAKSASYKIVNYTSLPLDSNQLYIRFINDVSSYYYFSTGNDNVYAKVNVSAGGKISVTIPATFLESYASPMSDSAQVTATINQQ